MEQKKPTRAQLENKIKNATLIVGKSKKSITFGDSGITIYSCKDEIVCSTLSHSHVYQRMLSTGNVSLPCLFLDALVMIAFEHLDEISEKDSEGNVSYSLRKLIRLETLKKNDREIVYSANVFLFNINEPLYGIGTTANDATNLFATFNLLTSKADTFLNARSEDVMQNEFYNELISHIRFNSLTTDLPKESKRENLMKVVKEAETEAYNKIKDYIESEGGKMTYILALTKNDLPSEEENKL